MKNWSKHSLWPLIFVALHLAKFAYFLRGLNFRSHFPLLTSDYALYYARALRVHEFFVRSGRFWGYDPFEMAGYVCGPVHEVGNHLISLLCHLAAPIIPIGGVLFLLEIMGLLGAPFFITFAVLNQSGKKDQAWIAFGITSLMYGLYEQFSTDLMKGGLLSFQVAVFLSFWFISLFHQWLRQKNLKTWLWFTGTAVLLPQIHPGSFVMVAVPLAGYLILTLPTFRWRDYASLLATLLLVLGGNWYWLKPLLAFSTWKVTVPYLLSGGWGHFFQVVGFVQPSLYKSARGVLHISLLVLAILALKNIYRSSRGVFWVNLSWLLSLALVGYFGSSFPSGQHLQPARYTFVFWVLVWILASEPLCEMVKASSLHRRLAISVFLTGVIIVVVGFLGPRRSLWARLSNRLTPEQQAFVDYAKKTTPFPGRFLLEGCDENTPLFQDLLPAWTHQVMLGGSNPGNNLITRTTLFRGSYYVGSTYIADRPIAFNRSLADFTEPDFESYLNLYNVRRVAAWSTKSKEILEGFSHLLRSTATVGGYEIFEVKTGTSSWFVEGKGEVLVDYDRIDILRPSRGNLTLKFHYLKTLKTSPPLPISPVWLKDDPVPFVSLKNDIKADQIAVYNGGL